jgi:hypothetical protein
VKLRDAQLLALQAEKERTGAKHQLIAFRVPGFAAGFVAQGGAPAAGDAFPQARVRQGEREAPFDDIAGRGFLVLARGADPRAALSPDDLVFWRALGGTIRRLGDDILDSEGHYGRVMDEYGCDIIIKRPDHYIFGACRNAGELPALMADLRDQLRTGRTRP